MNEYITRGRNRRLAARRSCLLGVRYRAQGGEWRAATVTDVSSKGCRLRIGEDLERGAALELAFEAPLKDGSTSPQLEVPATVTWSRPEGLSRHVGLEFPRERPEIEELLRAIR
ncbi:MAG: PilZ domain-containing protein [Vicinamibacteria bacterium]|nr:PilZ domain-containing protein [Vicinamibacteria bacterium]